MSSKPGDFDIVRIFERLPHPSRLRRRLTVLLLAVALSACTTHERAASPPEAPVESLLPPPPATGAAAERTLGTLPQNAEEEGPPPQPIIVRGTALPAVTPSSASAAAVTPAQEGGDVTLNFSGADIRDVIASVLGQTLKLNYVIDPDVTGPVTFNVSGPLKRSEVLPVLEAVLASRGVALVQSDGIVRVTARATRGAVPLAGGGTVGEGLEAFPIRYVAAGDIAGVVAKLLPAGTVMIPDERRHVLLVQGSGEELRLVADTVRIFDVDTLAGASVALLPLKNADAASVTVELQNIFGVARKEPDAEAVRVLAVDRLNAVMVLTHEARYLDEARAWVARLDQTRNLNEQRVYVYYLQYGKASQVAETLQGALGGLNVEVKGAPNAASEGIAGASGGSGLAGEVPPTAPGFPTPPPLVATPTPPPATPAAAPGPASEQKPSIKIEADETHNALLITATPRDYGLIRQVLDEIDTPPLQVLIEVTVAEVTLNDNLQYGVQYFVNSRGLSGGNVSTLLTTSAATAIAPAVPGFSVAYTGANLAPRVVLSALSALTQTKVVSTPRLMVLDNETARLQVGDVVPIITQSAASTLSSSPLVLSNVQYKETGVVLEVTPRVNSSGYVTLDINQSISDVVPTTSSSINSPTFSQRRLTSTISVKSGSSILLGGLIQKQDNRNSAGIPFLQNIPVLGAIFGNRDDTAARTELVMFMTPYVLSNDRDANDITEHVRHEFQDVLDRANLAPPRPVPR